MPISAPSIYPASELDISRQPYIRPAPQPSLWASFSAFFRRKYRPQRLDYAIFTLFPCLDLLTSQYDFFSFTRDVLTGITLTVTLIPQSLAYVQLAGLPPQYGLYSAFIASIGYFLFGTTREISVGPFALASLIIGESLTSLVPSLGAPGSATYESTLPLRLEATMSLTFVTGVWFVLFAILQLGWLIDFISAPAIKALVFSNAIVAAISQIQVIFGVDISGKGATTAFAHLIACLSKIPQIHVFTCTIGIASIIALLFLDWYSKARQFRVAIPSQLLLVILMTLLSFLFSFHKTYHVEIIGSIPLGFPASSGPVMGFLSRADFWAVGGLIAIICFVMSSSISMTLVAEHGYRVNYHMELFAFGFCSLVGAFFGSYTTAASLSRALIVNTTKPATRLWNVITAILLGAIIFVLAPVLSNLPLCILAAIVIASFRDQFLKWAQWYSILQVSPSDGIVYIIVCVVTCCIGIQAGVFAAFICSIFAQLLHQTTPSLQMLRLVPTTQRFIPGQRVLPTFFSDFMSRPAEDISDQLLPHIQRPPRQANIANDTYNDIDAGTTCLTPSELDLEQQLDDIGQPGFFQRQATRRQKHKRLPTASRSNIPLSLDEDDVMTPSQTALERSRERREMNQAKQAANGISNRLPAWIVSTTSYIVQSTQHFLGNHNDLDGSGQNPSSSVSAYAEFQDEPPDVNTENLPQSSLHPAALLDKTRKTHDINAYSECPATDLETMVNDDQNATAFVCTAPLGLVADQPWDIEDPRILVLDSTISTISFLNHEAITTQLSSYYSQQHVFWYRYSSKYISIQYDVNSTPQPDALRASYRTIFPISTKHQSSTLSGQNYRYSHAMTSLNSIFPYIACNRAEILEVQRHYSSMASSFVSESNKQQQQQQHQQQSQQQPQSTQLDQEMTSSQQSSSGEPDQHHFDDDQQHGKDTDDHDQPYLPSGPTLTIQLDNHSTSALSSLTTKQSPYLPLSLPNQHFIHSLLASTLLLCSDFHIARWETVFILTNIHDIDLTAREQLSQWLLSHNTLLLFVNVEGHLLEKWGMTGPSTFSFPNIATAWCFARIILNITTALRTQQQIDATRHLRLIPKDLVFPMLEPSPSSDQKTTTTNPTVSTTSTSSHAPSFPPGPSTSSSYVHKDRVAASPFKFPTAPPSRPQEAQPVAKISDNVIEKVRRERAAQEKQLQSHPLPAQQTQTQATHVDDDSIPTSTVSTEVTLDLSTPTVTTDDVSMTQEHEGLIEQDQYTDAAATPFTGGGDYYD